MPLTVVTLSKVPNSLRGDLSKWMQEIADGVYVGNFNSKVRENLWKRICDNVLNGEATLSYACRNEIGYSFETLNTKREVIDYDGLPLVLIPKIKQKEAAAGLGFSNAAKFRKIKKYANRSIPESIKGYVIIDIETTGLSEKDDEIIELGAVKVTEKTTETFHKLLKPKNQISEFIEKMTGIDNEMVKDADSLSDVLPEFEYFIKDQIIVGYNVNFDIGFINEALRKNERKILQNTCVHDLLEDVRIDRKGLPNYRLQTVIEAYEIEKEIPHRALEDALVIYELSKKVNVFQKYLKEKHCI